LALRFHAGPRGAGRAIDSRSSPASNRSRASGEIVISRIDAICRFDVAERLGEIKIQTVVTCAQDDRVTPVHLSHAIVDRIDGARKVIFPWGGHAPSTLNADKYAEMVKSSLV
jgi:aminoacrylate hydrolase